MLPGIVLALGAASGRNMSVFTLAGEQGAGWGCSPLLAPFANCLNELLPPPSPPATRNVCFLGFWVLFWAGSIHHPPAKGSQASSPACPSHSSGRGVN